jgi:hypothetical protein
MLLVGPLGGKSVLLLSYGSGARAKLEQVLFSVRGFWDCSVCPGVRELPLGQMP